MSMMKCKECGAQVSTSAESCPQCGAKVKKPWGFFKWGLVALTGFLFLTCASAIARPGADRGGKSTSVGSGVPDVTVEAQQIIEDYESNELRGDEAYKGRLVRVQGFLRDAKKDILGDAYVTVGTGQKYEFPVVQCTLKKAETGKAASLEPGQRIVVVGRVSGLMANVQMRDCAIQ